MKPYGVIYKITNLVNGKIYVGLTTKTIEKRLNQHIHSNGCSAITDAIKKYGKENFKIEIICECFSKNELNEREIYFIDFYKSLVTCNGYNIESGGNSSKLSEKSKEKIRQKAIGRKVSDIEKLEKSINSRLNDNKSKKLTWDNVNYIRENQNNFTRLELANMFNVGKSVITNIISNKIWKDPSEDIIKLELMKQSEPNKKDLKSKHKLNWQIAYDIRENKDNLSVEELSKKYNVIPDSINNIIHNRTWKIECSPSYYIDKYKSLKINIVKKKITIKRTAEHCEKIAFSKSGEKSSTAKATWNIVCDIRINKDNLINLELAKLYNLSMTTIVAIMSYETWRIEHCPEELKYIMPEKSNIISISNINKNNKVPKLNWDKVAEIRTNKDNLSVIDFASKFKVHVGTIRRVILFQNWFPKNYPQYIKELIEENIK